MDRPARGCCSRKRPLYYAGTRRRIRLVDGKSRGCCKATGSLVFPRLSTLLDPLDLVDLLDTDAQASGTGNPCGDRVTGPEGEAGSVETHSQQLHAKILELFRSLGWQPHFLYAGDTADQTSWGRIHFPGGTPGSLNPQFVRPRRTWSWGDIYQFAFVALCDCAVDWLTVSRRGEPSAEKSMRQASPASGGNIAVILNRQPAFLWHGDPIAGESASTHSVQRFCELFGPRDKVSFKMIRVQV